MGSQSQFDRTHISSPGGLNPRSPLIRSAAVVRFRIWFATVVALSALLATLVRAQVSDEAKRKREEFLKTRQEARSESSPSDEESPSPKPKAKHKKTQKSPSPTPPAKAKAKKHKPSVEEEETPKPKPKPSETPEVTSAKSTKASSPSPKPKSKKKSVVKKGATPAKKKAGVKAKASPKREDESESEKPVRAAKAPKPSETPSPPAPAGLPRAIAVPTPLTAPPAPTSTIVSDTGTEEAGQLTIEKTGYDRPRSFWSRLFGGGGRGSTSGAGYRYLTRSVRAEIDRAPADHRYPRWQMIVVHNSGTRQGNARVFDYYHRHVRHMQNGLAYHFVIGNGTSTGNGQIEVGDRWRRQINGGHVHSDNLNNIALGICLVGDFNRDQPTRAQLECCEELIRYLRQRCGKIGSRYMIVRPHREVNPPRWATDCPGDAFPYSWFRRFQE
jgi:outer membrane biosynthesis protein TonB